MGRLKALHAADGSGGLACALQVAAVQRGEALAGTHQAARGGLGLGEAVVVERDVDVSLQAARGVPGGFAVADQTDPAAVL